MCRDYLNWFNDEIDKRFWLNDMYLSKYDYFMIMVRPDHVTGAADAEVEYEINNPNMIVWNTRIFIYYHCPSFLHVVLVTGITYEMINRL